MIWAKIDTGIYRNPKIRLAGRDARDVFVSVVLANSEQFADGSIPAIYIDPKYLADTLQCSEDQATEGLKRCVTLHLLHVTTDFVTIVGWDSEWRNKGSSNDRVKKHRAKRKAELESKAAPYPQENHTVTTDVTLHALHVTPSVTVGNAGNALDKNRIDKNREKEACAASLALAATETLNSLVGRTFSPTSISITADCKKLAAAGHSPEDVEAVVRAKHREWGNDRKMSTQLKPSVLLRPSNFAKYLAEDVQAGESTKPRPSSFAVEVDTESIFGRIEDDMAEIR